MDLCQPSLIRMHRLWVALCRRWPGLVSHVIMIIRETHCMYWQPACRPTHLQVPDVPQTEVPAWMGVLLLESPVHHWQPCGGIPHARPGAAQGTDAHVLATECARTHVVNGWGLRRSLPQRSRLGYPVTGKWSSSWRRMPELPHLCVLVWNRPVRSHACLCSPTRMVGHPGLLQAWFRPSWISY